jgi:secreted PhoX family phosphatase
MRRRDFVRYTGASAALALGAQFWRRAYAATATSSAGPYGPLAVTDANGVQLPPGFTSRVLGETGSLVPGTAHRWHLAPDGGACIPRQGGGYFYVSNSEVPLVGGAAAIEFDDDAKVVGAKTLLRGTNVNCAGGATPWGTWLSCEEWFRGSVYECYLDGRPAERRPELGAFTHEAVAVDPAGQRLYLTEDRPDGRFYRFTPAAYPDLTSGTLEAAAVAWAQGGLRGRVSWVRVSKSVPAAANPLTRASTSAFAGGEGCFFDSNLIYFTTKGDNRVWLLDPADGALECIYSTELYPDATLRGVDNITVSRSGDLFVAEDGGNMQLGIVTPDGSASVFLKVVGHDGSEITGPAFDPSGTRLYFSSQRGRLGGGVGVTFEVTGPFRSA